MTCDIAVEAVDEYGSRLFPLEQSQRHTTNKYHARKYAQIQAKHKHIISAQLLAVVAGLSSLLRLDNTAGLKLVIYICILRQYTFSFQETSAPDQVLKSFSFVLAHTPPSSPLPSPLPPTASTPIILHLHPVTTSTPTPSPRPSHLHPHQHSHPTSTPTITPTPTPTPP